MSTIQILDDSDPAVSYSSGWQKAGGSNEYNATTSFTNQPGTTANLTFVGVQVAVIGTFGPRTAGLLSPQSNYSVDNGSPNVYTASQDQAVHYNTRFYLSPLLPDGQHTLAVINLLDSDSLFIDYFLIYKSNNDTSLSPEVVTVTLTATASSVSQTSAAGTHTSGSNTGTIVGSALGAAALVIAAVALLLLLRGRRRRDTDEPIISSFRDDPGSVPASGHTRFPSDTLRAVQHGQVFPSTGSDIEQPYGISPISRPALQDGPDDALLPPPGYSSDITQPENPVQRTSNGNLLPSKFVNLSYNATS